MNELHELRDRLTGELKEYARKDLTAGALDLVDKLTHTIKNLDKIIAEDGASGTYPYRARRDGMGRYDSGYSRTDIKDRLRELMGEADEHARGEIQRLIEKM